MSTGRRCLLVEASDTAGLTRALAANPDELVVDLDSVPPCRKDDFLRLAVVEAVGCSPGVRSGIQVNRPGTRWFEEDIVQIVMAIEAGVDYLVVPETEKAEEIEAAGELLGEMEAEFPVETPIGLAARVRSAAGLSDLERIVLASPRLEAVVVDLPDASHRRRAAAVAAAAGVVALAGPGLAPDPSLPDGSWFRLAPR